MKRAIAFVGPLWMVFGVMHMGGCITHSAAHADGGADLARPGDGGVPNDAAIPDAAAPDAATPDAAAMPDAAGMPDAANVTFASMPEVPHNNPDGGVIPTPVRVVTIFPANYGSAANQTSIEGWADYVVQSNWLKTVAAPYGAAESGTSAHLTGPAITDTTFSNAQATAYVNALLATPTGAPYAHDGHTVYELFMPPGTTFGPAQTGCGYHFGTGGIGDSIAKIRVCTLKVHNLTTAESAMYAAGHELIESLTDSPPPGGYELLSNKLQPPTLTPWAYLESGPAGGAFSEIADLCPGTHFTENGYPFQRIWNNPQAAAGGDPCAPPVAPYYNVRTSDTWVTASAGQTVAIPLWGFTSGGTTSDWELSAAELADSSEITTMTANLVTPTISSPTSATIKGVSVPTINEGRSATLLVPVPATAPHGSWASIKVLSQHLDAATGNPILDPDLQHVWAVGVYVP